MVAEPSAESHRGGGAAGTGLVADARGRRLLFALLYFAEGAPIGFVWWALPVLLNRRGFEPDEIGALTGMLVLPWGLKFLWAPAVDLLRGPAFGLRGWIVVSQLAMVATLLPLLARGVFDDLGLLGALLLGHALAAATQDAAIDALAVRTAAGAERGRLNGWMQAGMLLGRGVFGGALLGLGERAIVGWLLATLACTLLVHLFYRAPQAVRAAEGRGSEARWVAFREPLRRALGRRATWVALAFAGTAGAAFEVAGSLAGQFLADLGLGDGAIGVLFSVVFVAGLGLGALLGGHVADRRGHRVVAGASGASVVLAVVLLALVRGPAASQALLGALYLATGAFTASSYALFMDLTDPRLGSTQFSAYMGATNLCEGWSARVGGELARARGYPAAFLVGAAVTLLSLPLLLLLGGRGARRAPIAGVREPH